MMTTATVQTKICTGCLADMREDGTPLAEAIEDRATWMVQCPTCAVWYCEDHDEAPYSGWPSYFAGCRVYGNDDEANAACEGCRPSCGCPECDPDHYRDIALDR